MAENLRTIPRWKREDPELGSAASELGERLDGPDLFVGALAGNMDEALAIKKILEGSHEGDADRLARAGLPNHVPMHALLVAGEVERPMPPKESEEPKRLKADEDGARWPPGDFAEDVNERRRELAWAPIEVDASKAGKDLIVPESQRRAVQ